MLNTGAISERVRRRFRLLGRVAVLAAVVPLGACETLSSLPTLSSLNPFGSSTTTSEIAPDEPAELLFNDGLARLEAKNFDAATKKFAELDKQYPYSTWSRRSLILTAYARYENREYDEAINAGRRFTQLYPSDKDAAYAQYIVGMSYFNQIPDVTRDQDRSERAMLAMDELLRKWPQSEYASDARQRLAVARDQLAGKEMDVGRFYLTKRNYTGAVNRFREVLVKYQTTRHSEEALARLAEAYLALGIVNEAQTAGAVLGHNFPDSQWYQDTYKLLQSGGLEPREDQGSWISRAFKPVARAIGL